MSGVRRDVGEIDELQMTTREALDDLFEEEKAENISHKELDEEQELIGNALMHSAMTLSRPKNDINDDFVSPGPHKNAKNIIPEAQVGEMALFGAHLRYACLARVDLESDRVAFELEKLACDHKERVGEREERLAERIESQKL